MNIHSKNNYAQWSPFKAEFSCILACAEHENITKAAERVGLTQASLSKIILKVESQLGGKIFVRSPRGVRLTEMGKSFVHSLKKADAFWKNYGVTGESTAATELRDISIGCHSSIGSTTLPVLLEPILKGHPQLRLRFEFKRSLEVTQRVASSEIDIGIVVNPVKNPDLIVKSIGSEFIALWSKGKFESNEVLYNSEMFLNEKILRMLKHKRLVQMDDYEVIANILDQTNLQGLLPSSVGRRFGFHQVSGKLLPVATSLIYRRDRFASKSYKNFIQMVSGLFV